MALKTSNKVFPESIFQHFLKWQESKQQPVEVHMIFFSTAFIELCIHIYQRSSLVLLLSCWLQVDSKNFGCSPEFIGNAVLKFPHNVFLLLFSVGLTAISLLGRQYLGRDTTEKQWIIIIINQHPLGPLALLLKLQICYYVCKVGTGECNGLSLPWGFTPLWFSESELYTLVYSCVPNWISASTRENWGCEKTSKMYKNTLTAVI